jgi:hypothetical protein
VRRRSLLSLALLVALTVVGAGTFAEAEVTATHDAVISFDSAISPRVLPRSSLVPVAVRVSGKVKRRKGRSEPASLSTLDFAITRSAVIHSHGLPVCTVAEIDPARPGQALEVCGRARIGYGRILARSVVPGQPHFLFNGRVLLFNGRLKGRPAILVYAFNRYPPSSFVFPFTITKQRGRYGTVMRATVNVGRWSRIVSFKLVLKRTFQDGGRRWGYLNASCPAPPGLNVGVAPIARARLGFGDGTLRDLTVLSACRVA